VESSVGRFRVPMRMAGWLKGVRTVGLGLGLEGVGPGGLGGIGRLRVGEWREEVAVRGRPRWTSSKIVRTFGSSISVTARSRLGWQKEEGNWKVRS
jgi:hypothetical protein